MLSYIQKINAYSEYFVLNVLQELFLEKWLKTHYIACLERIFYILKKKM